MLTAITANLAIALHMTYSPMPCSGSVLWEGAMDDELADLIGVVRRSWTENPGPVQDRAALMALATPGKLGGPPALNGEALPYNRLSYNEALEFLSLFQEWHSLDDDLVKESGRDASWRFDKLRRGLELAGYDVSGLSLVDAIAAYPLIYSSSTAVAVEKVSRGLAAGRTDEVTIGLARSVATWHGRERFGPLLPQEFARLRQESGMTQAELAEALGVSKRSISRIETAEAKSDMDMIEAMRRLAASRKSA